jgi:hypothetical protein
VLVVFNKGENENSSSSEEEAIKFFKKKLKQ